jgi:hypothetical protein
MCSNCSFDKEQEQVGHSSEEVDQILAKYGWTRHSEYIDYRTKMTVRFEKCGHINHKNLDLITEGHGCSTCSPTRRKTNEEIDFLLRDGWVRLENYINSATPLLVRCPAGHEIKIRVGDHARKGTGCSTCSKTKKLTNEEVDKRLRPGWKRIGNYINSESPIILECPEGHRHEYLSWIAYYHAGRPCPVCSDAPKEWTGETIDSILAEIGWVRNEEYHRADKPISMTCDRGHTFQKSWSTFIHSGTRCWQCSKERQKGEGHPLYRADTSKEERIAGRRIIGYWKWRYAVYERDGFTCQACGYDQGGILNAHHLNSYADYPEQRMDVSNGVTLCEKCHCLGSYSFHKTYSNKSNTAEQFHQWLFWVHQYFALRDLAL